MDGHYDIYISEVRRNKKERIAPHVQSIRSSEMVRRGPRGENTRTLSV